MSTTQVREVVDARDVVVAPHAAHTEPSHIHIPRPSRVAAVLDRHDAVEPIAIPLAPEEEVAA
jgi:hypothetical protein